MTLVAAPRGKVRIADDVATAFAAEVGRAFRDRAGPRFALFVSGGPTARRCYEALAGGPHGIDWSRVEVFWGDERCVGAGDADANERLVREALLDHVKPVGGIHPMSCDDGPLAYQALLEPLEAVDLVHLGLGPDGHTASLFAGSPALDAPPGQLVALNEDPAQRNAHRRMTLTLEAIARARLVVFTVSGADKATALASVLDGADLPATRVCATAVLWIVDAAALGLDSPPGPRPGSRAG